MKYKLLLFCHDQRVPLPRRGANDFLGIVSLIRQIRWIIIYGR